jgi:hypothetical protein
LGARYSYHAAPALAAPKTSTVRLPLDPVPAASSLPQGGPLILRRFARWLLRRRMAFLRRESRDRILRKSPALYDRLEKMKRTTCLFVNLPEKIRGRWGLGFTPAVMNRCNWVEPLLVAQIKFTE